MYFAAGVTLYNPTEEQIAHITKFQDSFDKIFLYDNSESNYNRPEYPKGEKFVLLTENENRGLPYAFNAIISHCGDYDFLCTLDQDSTFEHEDIMRLRNYANTLGDISHVGIIAPFVDYGYNTHERHCQVEKKKWVITSGAFVNLHVVRQEKLCYDLNFFIDKFEVDFCWQMTTRGYEIQMYHSSVLHQQLGENIGKAHSSHNALRHYYLFRNRFYFNNKWHSGLKKWFLNVAQTIRHLLMILRLENDKCEKLHAFCEALADYRKGRLGKKLNLSR